MHKEGVVVCVEIDLHEEVVFFVEAMEEGYVSEERLEAEQYNALCTLLNISYVLL